MLELLKLFFDICLFKKAPQDVPASRDLLYLVIIVYVCVGFLTFILSKNTLESALQVLIKVMLILGITHTVLLVAQKSMRYQQTVNALMGTDLIISFFSLPVIATLDIQDSVLAFIVLVWLMLWHWIISAHIFRHALNKAFIFGLGVSFMYKLTSYQIMITLFPEVSIN